MNLFELRQQYPHGYNSSADIVSSNQNPLNDPFNLGGTGLSYGSSDNPMIDAYYKANPFVGQTYRKTWIDKAFGGIIRTGYDKWLDEMRLNAAQFDASVVDLQQQLQYNSEGAKADRLRAAGLNPDMLGIEDASESTGLQPDVQDAQIPDAVDPLSLVSSVTGGLLNLIPQVLSFGTGIQQLKGIRLENDAKELAFGSSAIDAATKFFTESISDNDYKDAFDSGDWKNIIAAAKKDSDYLANTLFSSPSARRKWKLTYGMHQDSLIAKMQKYKTFGEFENARKGILTQRASPFFSDDDNTMQALLESVIGPCERWQKKMYEINEAIANLRDPNLEQGLKNKLMSNQKIFEDNIDPAAEAGAQNAANKQAQQEQEILKATNELFAEIMASLSTQNNWWSKIAMAMVGIARAQVLSGMHLQFGRRQNYEVDGDTGFITENQQSQFGVSF